MDGTLELNAYGELLAEALPRKIETESENERVLKIIEKLMRKGEDNLSPEETVMLVLLSELVESFEAKAYPEIGLDVLESLK